MGFIADFEENWADEMDVFGLKYFDSMDDYLKKFCWKTAFKHLDIDPQEMTEFLHIPKNELKWYYEYEKEMVEYFTKHPNEMKKKFYELEGSDEMVDNFFGFDIDHIYTNFVYAALIMRMKRDKKFSLYDNYGIVIHIGTNEEICMSFFEYLNYIEPHIFAKGEIAEKIIKDRGNIHFHKGPFYI